MRSPYLPAEVTVICVVVVATVPPLVPVIVRVYVCELEVLKFDPLCPHPARRLALPTKANITSAIDVSFLRGERRSRKSSQNGSPRNASDQPRAELADEATL